jgi:hypothetical protein
MKIRKFTVIFFAIAISICLSLCMLPQTIAKTSTGHCHEGSSDSGKVAFSKSCCADKAILLNGPALTHPTPVHANSLSGVFFAEPSSFERAAHAPSPPLASCLSSPEVLRV